MISDLYSCTRCPRRTSSSTELRCNSESLLLVSGKKKLIGARCCLVRAEAVATPIGGYYNSCSFAHWSGISSPQGQGAVSGILIGKSELIFTSLHIRLHLLANEKKSCFVWRNICQISGNKGPTAVQTCRADYLLSMGVW